MMRLRQFIGGLKGFRFVIPMLLILILAPLALREFSGNMEQKVSAESLQVLETSVLRAAVECYALEGFYPPDAAYLLERYGVSVDEGLYYIDYNYVGSNLMPSISVLPAMKGEDLDDE